MKLRTKWNVHRIDRMISNGEKVNNRKNQRFFKNHISAISKDVEHISSELIVIHMYFMCAKIRSCAMVSYCAIAIGIFCSLFLSEAVCSTGDPISIFKKDSESSNVLQNFCLGFLLKYCFIPENSCQSLIENTRAHEGGVSIFFENWNRITRRAYSFAQK